MVIMQQENCKSLKVEKYATDIVIFRSCAVAVGWLSYAYNEKR